MVYEMFFVRRAYTEILAHELKQAVRMLRAIPLERFDAREAGCGASARELAMGVVRHLRRIDEIAYGGATGPCRTGVPSRGEIMLGLETAYLGAHTSLATLPAARWAEVVPAPIGISTLRQGRRGELLWLALRELIRHDRHLALHVRGAVHGDAASIHEPSRPESRVGELPVGA